jgi:ABC-type proline/glycine betaine transport system ATPase subunit
MNNKGANTLAIKPMSVVIEETKEYVRKRKDGTEKSLKTNSSLINETFMDGFDWNRIITLGGMSGAGKSTLARQ